MTPPRRLTALLSTVLLSALAACGDLATLPVAAGTGTLVAGTLTTVGLSQAAKLIVAMRAANRIERFMVIFPRWVVCLTAGGSRSMESG